MAKRTGLSNAAGRSSRPFRRMRRGILGASDVCVVCGHGGADSVDHVEPIADRPDLAEDPSNLAPCHHEPCPTCGQRCNNVKGTKALADVVVINTSRDWFVDPLRLDEDRETVA